MSAYDNDPRVSKVHGNLFHLLADVRGDGLGTVYRYGDGELFTAEPHDRAHPAASGFATVDEAIHSLIGDPQ